VARPPETIRVGPYDIQVDVWTQQQASAAAKFGEFSALELTMRVDGSMPHWKIVDSLLHELGHAIWWAYSLQQDDDEERIVATMALAWTQMYRDTPALVAWLAEED